MKKQKTIYDLKLHESMIVKNTGEAYHTDWQIIRVASGWYYYYMNPNRTTVNSFFVPYDNSFQS